MAPPGVCYEWSQVWVSYLWCKPAREELYVLSWSVSVSSKLDVFFIFIVFFCKKNEPVSHPICMIWNLQHVIKIGNLSLWEAFHEGATCALVATGKCIICRVWAVVRFSLTVVKNRNQQNGENEDCWAVIPERHVGVIGGVISEFRINESKPKARHHGWGKRRLLLRYKHFNNINVIEVPVLNKHQFWLNLCRHLRSYVNVIKYGLNDWLLECLILIPLRSFTLEVVLCAAFPAGGSAVTVKLSGSSLSRIFDSFIRLSNFFLAMFSTCFLLADVCSRKGERIMNGFFLKNEKLFTSYIKSEN